jgi:hypothetical protein
MADLDRRRQRFEKGAAIRPVIPPFLCGCNGPEMLEISDFYQKPVRAVFK